MNVQPKKRLITITRSGGRGRGAHDCHDALSVIGVRSRPWSDSFAGGPVLLPRMVPAFWSGCWIGRACAGRRSVRGIVAVTLKPLDTGRRQSPWGGACPAFQLVSSSVIGYLVSRA